MKSEAAVLPPEPQGSPLGAGSPNRRKANFRFAVAAVLVIAVLAWLLNKSKTQRTEWESASPGAKSPDAVIEKFHLISTVQGEKHWELYSTSAQLFQTQKQAYADNIYAQYFKKNRMVSTLTADKAVINTETNETRVEGHIELITENGSKLETEKLNWDPDTDEIKTEARVHIYKGSDDITAVGMVADTQLNNVRFMKDVHTKVRDTGEVERFHEPKKF